MRRRSAAAKGGWLAGTAWACSRNTTNAEPETISSHANAQRTVWPLMRWASRPLTALAGAAPRRTLRLRSIRCVRAPRARSAATALRSAPDRPVSAIPLTSPTGWPTAPAFALLFLVVRGGLARDGPSRGGVGGCRAGLDLEDRQSELGLDVLGEPLGFSPTVFVAAHHHDLGC